METLTPTKLHILERIAAFFVIVATILVVIFTVSVGIDLWIKSGTCLMVDNYISNECLNFPKNPH